MQFLWKCRRSFRAILTTAFVLGLAGFTEVDAEEIEHPLPEKVRAEMKQSMLDEVERLTT